MTRKGRPAIGSRLSGLVEGVDSLTQPASTTLRLSQLQPGQFQPRTHFSQDALDELSRSVKEQGVLQPLLVRPLGGGTFEIVAGERRWRAAGQAGLDEVPVLIRTLSDTEARMAAAVENLQREDLNVIEEVRARLQVAAAILDVPENEAVARMFALDRHPDAGPEQVERLDSAFGALGGETWHSFIRNRAAVLNLPGDVQDAVREGLDYRKALIIGRVGEASERANLMTQAREGATVQTLRELVSPKKPAEAEGWKGLARKLSDARTLERLDERKRTRVEKLLRQLQAILEEE
ncbi:ParB/RepB/Spo0J family partition protein [Deinococcus humi]|uniref:ParB family chromosome partitioning protein n=1 Tax=Deinococcus humi TaxID=662880 RepID=A0A7W8JTL2_9DEIO|nr:ParB/RepB/Spo0J family partition protein [Deinococcus humi]MBB5363022.1 ParB family chromosome partitioning protein [Deinococcus humi]GGO25071.1 putative plasmid-partitioning protein ParB [Deinococcus humi]